MTDLVSPSQRKLFIDPSYRVFDNDGLFNLDNPVLNRDGQLLPFHRLREDLRTRGIEVHTADQLPEAASQSRGDEYYSLGIIENFERIAATRSAHMRAFVIMEPPVVAPALYAALPRLTAAFERVYLHNVDGDGYSLEGVDTSKLRKLFWPIPHNDVLMRHWENRERQKRVVVINGSHNPRGRPGELYSHRIHAMGELARIDAVDLYGMGWHKWWTRSAAWWPYWKNILALRRIYKGPCASKFEVLQNYDFCLCFENMTMRGYMTEKMFDSLYAGAIPLYWGPEDIEKYVPREVFIDVRKYSSWTAMWNDVKKLSPDDLQRMREAGREFLRGQGARPFFDSVQHICEAQP